MGFLMALMMGFFGCLGAIATLFSCFVLVLSICTCLSLEEWRLWRKKDMANSIEMIPWLLVFILITGVLDGAAYFGFWALRYFAFGGLFVAIGFYAGIIAAMFVIVNCKYLE